MTNISWLPRAAIVYLLLTPCAANAQTAAPQDNGSRWWAGAGGGYIAGRVDCSNCGGEPGFGDGRAFIVQGGVRATDRLLIGGEIYSTPETSGRGDFRDTHLLAIFQLRPFARAGFFLKGGYGMAVVKGTVPLVSGGTETSRTWGMGVMYGAGWVFREQRRVSFAPLAATYITTVGDVQGTTGVGQNVVVNGWFAGAVLMLR